MGQQWDTNCPTTRQLSRTKVIERKEDTVKWHYVSKFTPEREEFSLSPRQNRPDSLAPDTSR